MADVILHNRPEGTPSDNEFVAYGTPTTPSGQIKMSNFYTLLMSKLGFFKVSNLFSEIFGNPSAMTSARANLGVYSTAEVQSQVTQRALKSNVIEKDSTVAYTPTIGTHPVNKKYVDDKFPASGSYQWAGGSMGDQVTAQQVSIGKTLPNTNYQVVITKTGGINSNVPSPRVSAKGLSTFSIECYANGGNGGNPVWDWYIIMR